MFSPVVKANESVSTTITKERNPLKRNLKSLAGSIKENTREQKRIKTEGEDISDDGDGRDNELATYYLTTKRTGKDTVYGIYENADGKLKMGTKLIFIQNNNSIVDDVIYKGAEGLWSLVNYNFRVKSVSSKSAQHIYK